jgi:nicotinamidase-related amidase
MNSCLIVIDLQNDYFPGGNMALVGIEEAAKNARALLQKFRSLKLPIIHIQHISVRPGSTFFLPDTDGAAIHQLVTPQDGESVILKNYPNSFRDTSLLQQIKEKQIDSLVICGAMSHMCIDATTRAAFDYGISCTVAEDACATRDLLFKDKTVLAADVHASFMAALSAPYATVVSTSTVLQNMTK